MIRLLRLELLPSDLPQLLLIDGQRLEEALAAEVVLQNVEKLRSLDLPARAIAVGENIADGALAGGHARDVARNTMPDHLAEVALPLAAWTSLRVAKAVRVERARTIIATD